MSLNNQTLFYKEVLPIWNKKEETQQKPNVEIISKDYERLVLYFPASRREVPLGQVSGGAYMPMGGRVYQVEDKIIASTCEEHSRGATLHNFELHFLDFEGNILLTQSIETENFLVRTATHLFFLAYTKRYLDKNYSPILELHSFEINSLAHTKTIIEPPSSLRSFYTNEYISFISTRWKILPNQVSIVCTPWLRSPKNNVEQVPPLNFEYVF